MAPRDLAGGVRRGRAAGRVSPTATTCAAARSRASRRSWRRWCGRPDGGDAGNRHLQTASRCCARAASFRGRSSATGACGSGASGRTSAARARGSPWTAGIGDERRCCASPSATARGTTRPIGRRSTSWSQRGEWCSATATNMAKSTPDSNPNGSARNIAGIRNQAGNVVGMMPHPERAGEALTGGADGNRIWQSAGRGRGRRRRLKGVVRMTVETSGYPVRFEVDDAASQNRGGCRSCCEPSSSSRT